MIQALAIVVSFAGVVVAALLARANDRRRRVADVQLEAFTRWVAAAAASAHSADPEPGQLVEAATAKAVLLTCCSEVVAHHVIAVEAKGFVGSDPVVQSSVAAILNALRREANRPELAEADVVQVLFGGSRRDSHSDSQARGFR